MTPPRHLALVCCCTVGLAALACAPSAPSSPHQVLDASAEPLRTAFNAKVGKVRIVELVSPT